MHRTLMIECIPELLWIASSAVLLGLLVRVCRCRPDWWQLRRLSGDEVGAVQSLSFVLTVPLFILVMLFIVQLSQITIAKIVVEYAAQVAARSAQVWIPASLGPGRERENQLAGMAIYDGRFRDTLGVEFDRYRVMPGSGQKLEKIRFAAAMACVPICPSRGVGASGGANATAASTSLQKAYSAYAGFGTNSKLPVRLDNKLRYAMDNTQVDLQIWHRVGDEPPLLDFTPRYDEYAPGEWGWQDQLIVNVTHQFALLPGPGRILARGSRAPIGSDSGTFPGDDEVARRIRSRGGVHMYQLTATARAHNEGEKPAFEYVQRLGNSRNSSPSGPRVITDSRPYGNRRGCAECKVP